MSLTSGDSIIIQFQEDDPNKFPINRCHQRVVTLTVFNYNNDRNLFAINRCHQRVVTQLLKETGISTGKVSNQ